MNQTPRAELQWPQFEVIEVKNTLASKALVPGNPADAIAIASKRAETALKQLSHEFPAWMLSESNRLHELRLELSNKGISIERLDQLFTCAHDIKGQAATFGYPVAGIIGQLLCDLIEHATDATRIPLAVIDQHVDTIRAVVRQNIKDNGNAQVQHLICGLQVLDQSTLKKISPKQPVMQAV